MTHDLPIPPCIPNRHSMLDEADPRYYMLSESESGSENGDGGEDDERD